MAPLNSPGFVLLSVSTLLLSAAAIQQKVLSSFVYTRHGERTPFILPNPPTLTPLGAQQLFDAGEMIRRRYVTPIEDAQAEITTIDGISPYQLEYEQLTVLSGDDQWVSASAQAFMQGLYPPLQTFSNHTNIVGESTLQNGTNVVAPLGGYQYPNIIAATSNDLNSIWVSGQQNCPMYMAATGDYYQTNAFEALQNSTRAFYESLQPDLLDGIFSDASVGYFDAYYIYDYLNYASVHNASVIESLSPEELTRARNLAANWAFAMNADISVSGAVPGDKILAIAGRALATRILQAFFTNINSQGASEKMTLIFGGYEPMVAFWALADLYKPQNPEFYDLPEPGSSMIFELFSMQEDGATDYPDTPEMFVRFLYQNGTGDYDGIVEYPLFGFGPSQTALPFSDFITGIQDFMMYNVEDWCATCNSFSVFCPAFLGSTSSLEPASKRTNSSSGLSPAVAGAIGAVVTLVVAGLIFAAVMLFAGVRVHRVHKRRSDLGGFKGAEKLASDLDLTLGKGGAGTVVVSEAGPSPVRGHERVGSWELKDQAKAQEAQARGIGPLDTRPRRPSYEGDEMPINPYTPPVDPRQHV